MITELFLVILILYLIFARQKTIQTRTKLSAKEEQQLIDEWEPEPLASLSNNNANVSSNNAFFNYYNDSNQSYYNFNDSNRDNQSIFKQPVSITSAMSATVEANLEGNNMNNNEVKKYIQFASHNYLGFANFESIKAKCVETIKKYAVGSCGPRGFYGTMDIHLNLEKKLSDYFSTNVGNNRNEGNNREAIIYADNIGCCASVITAFAKRGDLLLIDEGCHYLITQGAMLSRANVIWYPHNDMKQLESYLQTVQEQDERLNRPLNRRYIVTEGLFHVCFFFFV